MYTAFQAYKGGFGYVPPEKSEILVAVLVSGVTRTVLH